jgi:hypothetical protein
MEKIPYNLMILGVVGKSGLDVYKTQCCFENITSVVYPEFKKLSHVKNVFVIDNYIDDTSSLPPGTVHLRRESDYTKLPHADFILYIDWDNSRLVPFDKIEQLTGAKRVVSLLEISVSFVDWCFAFRKYSHPDITTVIPLPCAKSVYTRVPKKKKIIIDHFWAERDLGDQEWTMRISDWLAEISDKYEIVRMTRWQEIERKMMKSHEIELPHCLYGEFLEKSNDAETFVVTRPESYGFGVLDMIGRGIRVVAPVNCLPPDITVPLKIPTFCTKEELLKIVTAPVEPWWEKAVDLCTDYSDVVRIIDEKFQEYLKGQ